MSEVIGFADRKFYNDWWNCISIMQFWKDWNLPVHHWFLRHMYYPLQYRGVSRQMANTLIFMVSAFAHEYMISLSLGIFGFKVFITFAAQYVYIIFETYLLRKFNLYDSKIGNFIFWFNMCVVG